MFRNILLSRRNILAVGLSSLGFLFGSRINNSYARTPNGNPAPKPNTNNRKLILVFNIDEDGNISLSKDEGSARTSKDLPSHRYMGGRAILKDATSISLTSLSLDDENFCCIRIGNQHFLTSLYNNKS